MFLSCGQQINYMRSVSTRACLRRGDVLTPATARLEPGQAKRKMAKKGWRPDLCYSKAETWTGSGEEASHKRPFTV